MKTRVGRVANYDAPSLYFSIKHSPETRSDRYTLEVYIHTLFSELLLLSVIVILEVYLLCICYKNTYLFAIPHHLVLARSPTAQHKMCWERKVRYWTCGHYGDSTWEQCALYPDCGHTIWGIPYEEGGLGPQDDVVVNEKCPRHGKKKKEHWPDGMSFLPDDDR